MGKRSYTVYVLRHSPLFMVGVCLVSIVVVLAIFASLIAPYDPYKIDALHALERPSMKHPMGTDGVGRDIFSRVVYGSRTALLIPLAVVSLSLSIGVVVGTVGGYFGGLPDMISMRIADGFLSIPAFALAMVAAAVLKPSLIHIIWALVIVSWTWNARIVRSEVLKLSKADFVLVQKSLGASHLWIMFKHIIPNCTGPISVQASLQFGRTILASAALSFLGLGAQPPLADWGLMVAEGRHFLPTYWWFVTFPGISIFLLVAGFLLMGDGVRDIFEREVA